MHVFDTNVQYLKYRALKEVAKAYYEKRLDTVFYDVPKEVFKGPKPQTRCCVFKERAIFGERIKMAMGGDPTNPNVIEVMDIACDECEASGYTVSDSCHGCIAHRCSEACKVNAISFDDKMHAHIDKSKCVNCGACSKACQFQAIINKTRPCEKACKIKAIHMSPSGASEIDNSKCISCGACVYQCPFGAINDKSYILDVLKYLDDKTKKVYAVVAPSISSQFSYAKLGQVITGIKNLGFHAVVEAALGADMVAIKEAKELSEKKFLTSSCCPAFVDYIEKQFPKMKENISSNLSPMAELGKYIKESDDKAIVIFIGPCTAKKMELKKVSDYVDSVITFEELQALIDSKDIKLEELTETPLDNASYFGRIFARSGGLKDAVMEALKEQNIEFDLKALASNGIEECKVNLLKASKKLTDANFIEGMACVGGCIGGPCCLSHGPKDLSEVDKYGREAFEKKILDFRKIMN